MAAPRARNWKLHLLVQVLLFATLAAGLELYCGRLLVQGGYETGEGHARRDPYSAFRVRPNEHFNPFIEMEDVVTNSDGLRDSEVTSQRPANEIRVLCLGGSLTFGVGLQVPDTWPMLLQMRLQVLAPAGVRIRVINGGQPGFTSYNAAGLLDDVGPRYQPQIVVSMLGFNDAQSLVVYRGRPQIAGGSVGVMRDLLPHSATYRYMCWRLLPKSSDPHAMDPPPASGEVEPRTWWDAAAANLAWMAAWQGSRGGHLLICSEAKRHRPEDYGNPPPDNASYARMETAWEALGSRLHVPVIIMNRVFEATGQPDDALFQARNPVHTTVDGSHLIANAVAAALWKEGWIPRAGR